MPNIFKYFSSHSKAEPYQFPDAAELIAADVLEALEEEEPLVPEEEPAEEPEPVEEKVEEKEEEPSLDEPIQFAQIQAEKIMEDARRQAEEIIDRARLDAELQADQIRTTAREEGHRSGYADGLTQAQVEGERLREEQAAVLENEVKQFLDRAAAELDHQMDQNIGELRDLALAIAEKVVCVSLKSSGDVISRMIQTAVDKRKRREWVHIYIAECDAKLLTQVPATLSSALSALSDRVRIIPMADDESGTCIIEMPDEIIDASAATQLNNIRSLLMDTPSSTGNGNLFR